MKRTFPPLPFNIPRQSAEIKRQATSGQEQHPCNNEHGAENDQRHGKLFHLRNAAYASMALQKVELTLSRRNLVSPSRNLIRYGCCMWNASASWFFQTS